MAAKTNLTASAIDKTSFFFVANCGVCHPGGGPGEYDRDGKKYFDEDTNKFGYEALGRLAQDVTLDGDYCFLNPSNGAVSPARWDSTGLAEPDCLMCHRAGLTPPAAGASAAPASNWVWRSGTLRGSTALKDASNNPVKAFAAAASAGQGWLSTWTAVAGASPPQYTMVQLDYGKGLTDGSLVQDTDGSLRLSPSAVVKTPRDLACWGCHVTPDLKKRGRDWFNKDSDVHYARANNLHDADSTNDIPVTSSTACAMCHTSGMDHNFTKGNSMDGTVSNNLDYTGLRTCAECHLADSPNRDPLAPIPEAGIHEVERHMEVLACQACHIPYRDKPTELVIDNATTGSSISYSSTKFLSADPLNPAAADKTKWYPSFRLKLNKTGQMQLFPQKLLLTSWWGDWDQKGTLDKSDDVIAPIPLWRIRSATGSAVLTGVVDDNADGIAEVNTKAEILLYINRLKSTTDRHGTVIAQNPVLAKGGKVYYEDTSAPGGVNFFSPDDFPGLHVDSASPFGEDHNVLKANKAIGSTAGGGCAACHASSNRKFFDRKVLVDPFDLTGTAVYSTVSEMTGIDP